MLNVFFFLLTFFLTIVLASSNDPDPLEKLIYSKGKNVIEGGFFDPNSSDFNQAIYSFIINVHPVYKPEVIPFSLYTISQQTPFMSPNVVDTILLDNCVFINSHWESKGVASEEMEKILKSFWDDIGAFEFVRQVKWVEDKDFDDNDGIIGGIKKNNNKKKLSKSPGSSTSSKSKSSPKICSLMKPELLLRRSTLENPICQRTISIAISVLSPDQVVSLFHNLSIEILDNPAILDNIIDFSQFKDGKAVDQLIKIFQHKYIRITSSMARTLPLNVLYQIIKSKNFDISYDQLNILILNRPGFEREDPFISDHRTFRLFCIDTPMIGLPPADLILSNISNENFKPDLIESILAYYIRTEYGINYQLSLIHHHDDDINTNYYIVDLIGLFYERNRIISALRSVDEKLANFIKIPLNLSIRLFINGQDSVNPLKSTWNYLFFDSSTTSDTIATLRSTMTYSPSTTPIDSYEIFGQWIEITEKLSESFREGRWARNYLQSLLANSEICEKTGESDEISMKMKVSNITGADSSSDTLTANSCSLTDSIITALISDAGLDTIGTLSIEIDSNRDIITTTSDDSITVNSQATNDNLSTACILTVDASSSSANSHVDVSSTIEFDLKMSDSQTINIDPNTADAHTSESHPTNTLAQMAKNILSRHLGSNNFTDFSFSKYDWFLIPLSEVWNIKSDGSTPLDLIRCSYKMTREATKILSHVDFFAEGVIEAIKGCQNAMDLIIKFPFCLQQRHVDALVQTEIGKKILKQKPLLLTRLPSYANFSLEDMEEFNINLDDFVGNIGTLNVEVGREWLKKREYLVNNSTSALFYPHKSIYDNNEVDTWQFVTFEALRADYSLSNSMKIIDKLRISKYLDDIDNISDKLSLVSRWLIHLESQSALLFLLSRLPHFNQESNNVSKETLMFMNVETIETPKIIKNLKKEFEKEKEYGKKKIIREMMLILKETTRTISSFKANLTNSMDGKILDSYEKVCSDNEFICSLIETGSGSEKFKRVWIHRAKLLVYPSLDIKTLNPFPTQSAAEQGMIPLDVALLQWFIENKNLIDRLRIDASIRKERGEPVRRMDISQNKYAKWFNILIPED